MLPWTRKIHFSKKTLIVFAILGIFLFLGFANSALAQNATDTLGIGKVEEANIALSGIDIRTVVVRIINTVLGLLGLIAVSLILYAGFTIMTAGGDEGKVETGKKIIINAVIGLVVILSAFAIVKFVANKMLDATGFNRGNENTGQAPGLANFSGSGALGRTVRDHYPFRDQVDVARNTAIVVTFNIPIDPGSVIQNTNNSCWNSDNSGPTTTCDVVDDEIVKPYYGDCIFDADDNMACDKLDITVVKIDTKDNIANENSGLEATAVASYERNTDGNIEVFTFVFRPKDNLGSATENVDYTVKLLNGILRSDNQENVFSLSSPYIWNFQTGTKLDLSPPHVVSVSPSEAGQDTKDTVIQINFDEAIDPTSVQGELNWLGDFDNILINTVGTVVTGTWKISNGYQTVEFIPHDICGTNSCGATKYCLPVTCTGVNCTQDFSALIRTATSAHNENTPFQAQPFSGVYDMSVNALDTEDATKLTNIARAVDPVSLTTKIIFDSEKNPDNYDWSFEIENRIDNKSPYIKSITPLMDSEKVVGNAPVTMNFSKRLLFYSISRGVGIEEYPVNVCSDAAVNITTPCLEGQGRPLPNLGYSSYAKNISETETKVNIEHREFGPNGLDLFYFTTVTSTLQDKNQNCFYPGFGPANKNTNGGNCLIKYNNDGDITEKINCVEVNMQNGSEDTGCVYSIADTESDINSCLTKLREESTSVYVSGPTQ